MLTNISVCGDSFGVGIGISNNPYEIVNGSFGNQVAKHFNVPMKMYSRSGCCNYVIYLQVKKIIQQFEQKKTNPFVLITTTHHSRFVFPIGIEENYVQYDLSDVDYKTYNIFPTEQELIDFLPFELKPQPSLSSDTVSNLLYFKRHKLGHLKKLFLSIESKLDMIDRYYRYLYSDSVKHNYDESLIATMHLELKHRNIPHLILAPNNYFSKIIDKENFLKNDWGYYTRKYPDEYKSGHCTIDGHTELSKKIIEHMKQYGYEFSKI